MIFRLERRPDIEQAILLGWIRQLARQLELLYRCSATCGYRYLNPYSILVTPEEKIFLLDLDAEGNAVVLRSMQKRAIRNNFMQKDYIRERGASIGQDLFGFGRTIQFILANVTVRPYLSGLQERRLRLLIQRCTGKSRRKQFENFSRIQKAIPAECTGRFPVNKNVIQISGVILFFCISVTVLFSRLLAEQARNVELENQLEEYKAEEALQDTEKSFAVTTSAKAAETETPDTEENGTQEYGTEESDTEQLRQLLLNNDADDNREVIELGEELHCEVMQCLASAYDREGMTEKALAAYEELCGMEAVNAVLEQAYSRRIALEEEKDNGENALDIAEKAAERLPDSQKIALLYLKMLYCYGEKTEEEFREKEKEVLAGFPELEIPESYQMSEYEKEAGR